MKKIIWCLIVLLVLFFAAEKINGQIINPIYPENIPIWPYINHYQYQNHAISWQTLDTLNDIRIYPNGQGHIDNWDFKGSFENYMVRWRNGNPDKWFCRYYFDERIESMVCGAGGAACVPEPCSFIFLFVGLPLIFNATIMSHRNKQERKETNE